MRALVTGAASRIGRALAETLAGEGCEIVAVDRSQHSFGWTGTALQADLSDRAAVDRLTGQLVDAGPYDIVIHNAGECHRPV